MKNLRSSVEAIWWATHKLTPLFVWIVIICTSVGLLMFASFRLGEHHAVADGMVERVQFTIDQSIDNMLAAERLQDGVEAYCRAMAERTTR